MKYKFKMTKFNQELSVIDLVNRHFCKSLIGIVMSLSLPLMFMIIYLIVAIYKNKYILFANNLSLYLSFAILPVSLISLPLLIVEFKSSIILRKIAVSKITSLSFTSIVILYYSVVNITVFIITILLYAIFLNVNAPTYFSFYNWGELIYAIINLIFLSSSVGLFIGVVLKKAALAQAIGLMLIFLSQILSGQLIPMSVISQVPPIKYISLLCPLTYPLDLLNNVLLPLPKSVIESLPITLPGEWTNYLAGNSIFNLHTFYFFNFSSTSGKLSIIPVCEGWHKILNLIMPIIMGASFMFYNIIKFNWSSR